MSEWNYGVPNCQDEHTYIRILYGDNYLSEMTDNELMDIAKTLIRQLKSL